MADQDLQSLDPADVEVESPPPLDPEVVARRREALKRVRKWGDPVLRTKALPVDRFDDALRTQTATMGALMDDALGVGLAATQVGLLQRLFVYRVVQGAPLNVLVNPVIEWSSKDEEWLEEGCLSLPAVHVDVERPVHVRVTAQGRVGRGDPDRGQWPRGTGHPARARPPGRGAHPGPHPAGAAQGGHARAPRSPRSRRRGMRTVYLGTSPFAAAILETLAAGPHRPQLVVTRPDRPAGRGRKLTSPAVAQTARELGLELSQPDDVNGEDARRRILDAAPDVLIVCAFGALIRQGLLDAHTILNVHPSLLPRWRGAAPIERAIMAGDPQTGVAIMRLTAGLDSGPVGLVATEPIHADDTFASLGARLQDIGGVLLTRALDDPPPYVEQDESRGVTYAEKITATDRTLDPGAGALAMDRTVRALSPHIGARIDLGDGRFLGVLRSTVLPPGTGGPDGVLQTAEGRLTYGDLELVEVQPAGGRPMQADAYVRGHLQGEG